MKLEYIDEPITSKEIFIKVQEERERRSVKVGNTDLIEAERKIELEIVENKELTRDLIDDKTSILDVRAKTENDTQIDIEVQLTNQHNMDKRTLFYWGRIFNESISKGEDYKNLPKVITINILDFDYNIFIVIQRQ